MGVNLKDEVEARIAAGDSWYTSDQFEYSFGDARFVHALRERFLRKCIRSIQARLRIRPIRIAEVGCGDGVNLFRLRDLNECEFHGFDYNELRLARARKLVPSVTFTPWNLLEDKPCPISGGVHLLMFSHVIEHLKDDAGVLNRLRTWLAPGGGLALLTPNEGCLLARLQKSVFDSWIAQTTDHVNFYTYRSLRRLVTEQGFTIRLMRGEVFTFPKYRFHMALLRRRWGYAFLRIANLVLPRQTSGWQLFLEVA